MDEKIINIAMEIILNAGDARNCASDAIDKLMDGNTEECDLLMSKSQESIKKAHLAQTNVIQDEARGNSVEIRLLFIHAQDTLMTIASEINMLQKMRIMYEKMQGEIDKCKK